VQNLALYPDEREATVGVSSIAHFGYMLLGLVALASVTYPAPAFFDGLKASAVPAGVYLHESRCLRRSSLPQRNVIGDELDDLAGIYFRSPTEPC